MQKRTCVAYFGQYNKGYYAMLKVLSLVLCFFLLPAVLFAQSRPSAEGGGSSLWVGGEISTFNPDYECASGSPLSCWDHQLLGFAPFVDAVNLLPRLGMGEGLGIEGEARFLHWRGPYSGFTESSYLVGPRFGLVRVKDSLRLIGKVGVGRANIALPPGSPGNGDHFAYAPGIIAEVKVTPRVLVRGGYEYQVWPGFKGVRTSTTTGCCGLTPNGFSLGLSYELLR